MIFFNAVTTGQSIELEWKTAVEVDLRGFEIWRSTTEEWPDAIQLSDATIASRGAGNSGATYSFMDNEVDWGERYTYWLRTINTSEDVKHK